MQDGVWGRPVPAERRHVARWCALLAVVALVGVGAWQTASVGTAIELVAVVSLLLGAAVAFGALDRHPRRGSRLVPPERRARDARVAGRAADVLSSLDRIEHRRLEVGIPWPQVLVGPTGAAVVELCPVGQRVEVDASGVRDRDRGVDHGRLCCACQEARRLAATVRSSLDAEGIAVPVRTIAVVSERTEIVIAPDAPSDVCVVPVDRLADAVSRGPVLPMSTVDAVFTQLTRAVAGTRLSVHP